ncbi:MAG: PEP-CTERM sorting domain-containing protein [Nitrosomonas sp.]|nr:PEP-CTERM sorting domain-containing protein [Nitrosomonas sp.]
MPLIAVPEPSIYAMLLTGLGLLFFRTQTELNS